MSDNTSAQNDAWKNEVEKLLDHLILNAYRDKKISYDDMRYAAGYIIDNIDPLQSHDEIIKMIEEMHARWPVFQEALDHVHSKKKAKENES